MSEENKMSEVVDEIKNASEEELKQVIEQHFEAVRAQGMKIGATYIAAAVYGAIEKNLGKAGKPSLRDYQRATKRVLEIVSVQLDQQETQQNDLSEEQGGDES